MRKVGLPTPTPAAGKDDEGKTGMPAAVHLILTLEASAQPVASPVAASECWKREEERSKGELNLE